MGKLAVYKYFSFMLLLLTVMVAIFTWFGLFGGYANPGGSTALSILVYALPALILVNMIMLVYWLIRRRWYWLVIPAVTLIACIPYIGTIYQTGIFTNSQSTKAGIKVATYNVAAFNREIKPLNSKSILLEMKEQGIDVFCMQEYRDECGDILNSDNYKEYFPYMAMGRSDMVIYSRYPIDQKGILDFGKTNNSGMWADIDVNGRMMRVFNVHLETTGFNRTLYRAGKDAAKGNKVEFNALVRDIYYNYTRGMVVRAQQADLVSQAIQDSDIPVIVCGDFNDVPYSYTYRTILGDLVDGFKECGKGFMYTYSGMEMPRIDYIFHSDDLEGENYYFKKNKGISDHYPVFIKIVL